jgi:dihydrodipicolinate synthase/N-acetylneuraminate lyase
VSFETTKLRGVIPPLVTPLKADGTLDHVGMERLVEKVLAGGVHGVFAGGTTGEYSAVPIATRVAVIHSLRSLAAGRVPVLASVGAATMEDTLVLIRECESAKVDAVVVQAPAYFPLTEDCLQAYLESVIAQCPLPVVLYHIPSCTVNHITPGMVADLVRNPRVVAMKDSSGDLDYLGRVLTAANSVRPGFPILAGDEGRIVESVRLGAAGCVPSLANVHPGLLVRCWQAADEGNWEEAEAAQSQIRAIIARLRRPESRWIEMLTWIKQQLADEGVCGPHVARQFPAVGIKADKPLVPA